MSGVGLAESALILDKLHSFYLSAFDQTLVVVGIVFGFVGVIVPVGVTYFQAIQARREIDSIKDSISAEVSRQLKSMKEDLIRDQQVNLATLENRSRDELAEFKGRAEIQFKRSTASVFHVQALHLRKSDNYSGALRSACRAATGYMESNDYDNFRSAYSLAISCLPKLGVSKGVGQIRVFEDVVDSLLAVGPGVGLADLQKRASEHLEKARSRLSSAPSSTGVE